MVRVPPYTLFLPSRAVHRQRCSLPGSYRPQERRRCPPRSGGCRTRPWGIIHRWLVLVCIAGLSPVVPLSKSAKFLSSPAWECFAPRDSWCFHAVLGSVARLYNATTSTGVIHGSTRIGNAGRGRCRRSGLSQYSLLGRGEDWGNSHQHRTPYALA